MPNRHCCVAKTPLHIRRPPRYLIPQRSNTAAPGTTPFAKGSTMTAYTETSPRNSYDPNTGAMLTPVGAGIYRVVTDSVSNAVHAVSRWHRRNVAARQLAALNDHMLADIGIERGQISDVAATIGH